MCVCVCVCVLGAALTCRHPIELRELFQLRDAPDHTDVGFLVLLGGGSMRGVIVVVVVCLRIHTVWHSATHGCQNRDAARSLHAELRGVFGTTHTHTHTHTERERDERTDKQSRHSRQPQQHCAARQALAPLARRHATLSRKRTFAVAAFVPIIILATNPAATATCHVYMQFHPVSRLAHTPRRRAPTSQTKTKGQAGTGQERSNGFSG